MLRLVAFFALANCLTLSTGVVMSWGDWFQVKCLVILSLSSAVIGFSAIKVLK